MGRQVFTNNATTTLSGTLAQGGTTMVCASGQGNRFPSLSGGDYFNVTLYTKDLGGVEQNYEVVKVTARTGDTFTIVRDVENIVGISGGRAYDGSAETVYIQLRWTAGTAANSLQQSDVGTLVQAFDADLSSWSAIAPSAKQDTLVSGTSIKTINSASILGSGNITTGDVVGQVSSVDSEIALFSGTGGKTIKRANLTGLLKAAAGVIAAAVAGTDYIAPSGALGTPSSGTLTNCTADGTSSVGFRQIPQNSQSANYTCVLADGGKHVLHPSADTTARTFTIPANSSVAYALGTAITFINQSGAGSITISIATDTMRLAGAGTTGNRTLAANGIATAIKVTSTEWIISGTGLS